MFIRHTDEAEEVDEDTFFYDQRSGGTVVLSALELMKVIVTARFPRSEWNIYAAQASDGDAFGADAGKSARFLREELLPLARYFAYIETPEEEDARKSPLWVEYQEMEGARAQLRHAPGVAPLRDLSRVPGAVQQGAGEGLTRLRRKAATEDTENTEKRQIKRSACGPVPGMAAERQVDRLHFLCDLCALCG